MPAYALTEYGERLRDPVEGLAIWGFELLDPERDVADGDLARASLLASTMAAGAARRRSPQDPGVVVNFDVDGDRFHVRLGKDRAHVRHGEREEADSSLSCDMRTFYELTRGERRSDDPVLASVLAEIAP